MVLLLKNLLAIMTELFFIYLWTPNKDCFAFKILISDYDGTFLYLWILNEDCFAFKILISDYV